MLDGVQDVKRAGEGHLHVDEAGGQYRRGSCARPTTMPAVTAGVTAFDQNDRQHAKAIAEGVQVAYPMDPGVLEAGNFSDTEAFLRYPHMDQRLDLEAVTPQPPVTPG